MTSFKKRACIEKQRIPKVTLKAMVSGQTQEFFESMSDDQWDIESFDPFTRVVCVVIYSRTSMLAASLREQIEVEMDIDRLEDLQNQLDNLAGSELTDRKITVTLPEITYNRP
jgi:hypothetical protein